MLDFIYGVWDTMPETIKVWLTAFAVSFLRILYDDSEPRRLKLFIESVLCGIIAAVLLPFISLIGLSAEYNQFLAAAVGVYGFQEIRSTGYKFWKAKEKK